MLAAIALATFLAPPSLDVAPGFSVELVAMEPLIEAPVSLAFDEDGRLWVVELRTYMNDVGALGERSPRNRVVVLEDTDRNGRMDRRTVFLEGLVLPRGATPCRGGALVIEPPWLLHCVDLDGDGRADVKRRLIDGFEGLENPEHAGNGPILGHDNRWEFSQHAFRVRFDGVNVATEAVSPHGQWGIVKDDAGRVYTSPNSQPLLVDLLPRTIVGARRRLAPLGIGLPIVEDGSVHPAGPTRGVNRGYQAGVLREDGTLASFTGACGPSIVRTDFLGSQMRGAGIVCEAAGNLVVRYRFDVRDGVPRALRIDEDREFLRAADERFRPVASAIGPDGALYIADMARGVIQHRIYLTDYLKTWIAQRGLEQPLDRGRIWRVVPADAPPPQERRAWPALGSASDEVLVATLRDDDGWWRDTAQRLLVERGALEQRDAIRTHLGDERPEVRLHALWTLDGLELLAMEDLAVTAKDPHPWLRSATLRIAASRQNGPDASAARAIVAAGLVDADRVVRAEGRAALAGLPPAERVDALLEQLALESDDPLLRDAALAALGDATVTAIERATSGALRSGLFDRLLAAGLSGSAAERSDLIALAVAQAAAGDGAPMRAILRLVADEKRSLYTGPVPLILSTEPTALLALRDGGAMEDAAALLDRCTWPGREQGAAVVDTSLVERGRRLFTLCAGCHGSEGTGLPGLAPSLAASPYLHRAPDRLARILLHGLTGGRSEDGRPWTSMPPVGLRDRDLTAITAYLRATWGGSAANLSDEDLAALREDCRGRSTPWTREELDDLP